MTKKTRKRDYKAEYQRRIQRGLAKGLSRSQSRGHPKAKEKPVSTPHSIPDKQLQISLKLLRSGISLSEAARQIRVSPERLRNQAASLGAIKKDGGRWKLKQRLPREMLVYSNGEERRITVSQFKEASKLGRYMAAVGYFLTTNEIDYLEPFIGKWVKDREGMKHLLETNPNILYRLTTTGSQTFEQIYRIVV
jgi:hypothetical protein